MQVFDSWAVMSVDNLVAIINMATLASCRIAAVALVELLLGFTLLNAEMCECQSLCNHLLFVGIVLCNHDARSLSCAGRSLVTRPLCRYMYCNLPNFTMQQGERVRLYVIALGSSADLHTPNSVESNMNLDGHRKQSIQILPGGMLTTDVA